MQKKSLSKVFGYDLEFQRDFDELLKIIRINKEQKQQQQLHSKMHTEIKAIK